MRNEVNKFLNSNLEPYEDFHLTSKVTPREVREYLEELGWDFSDYDTDFWCIFFHFFNAQTKKRVTLFIDAEEFKMKLYWRD